MGRRQEVGCSSEMRAFVHKYILTATDKAYIGPRMTSPILGTPLCMPSVFGPRRGSDPMLGFHPRCCCRASLLPSFPGLLRLRPELCYSGVGRRIGNVSTRSSIHHGASVMSWTRSYTTRRYYSFRSIKRCRLIPCSGGRQESVPNWKAVRITSGTV